MSVILGPPPSLFRVKFLTGNIKVCQISVNDNQHNNFSSHNSNHKIFASHISLRIIIIPHADVWDGFILGAHLYLAFARFSNRCRWWAPAQNCFLSTVLLSKYAQHFQYGSTCRGYYILLVLRTRNICCPNFARLSSFQKFGGANWPPPLPLLIHVHSQFHMGNWMSVGWWNCSRWYPFVFQVMMTNRREREEERIRGPAFEDNAMLRFLMAHLRHRARRQVGRTNL